MNFHHLIFRVLSTPCEETLRELTNVLNSSKTFPKWTQNHLGEILHNFMDANGILIVQVDIVSPINLPDETTLDFVFHYNF